MEFISSRVLIYLASLTNGRTLKPHESYDCRGEIKHLFVSPPCSNWSPLAVRFDLLICIMRPQAHSGGNWGCWIIQFGGGDGGWRHALTSWHPLESISQTWLSPLHSGMFNASMGWQLRHESG